MSHLQPRFIAKAKAAHKRSKAPRQMPDKMIRSEAEGYGIEVYTGPGSNKKENPDVPGMWYYNFSGGLPYLKFMLKKGK